MGTSIISWAKEGFVKGAAGVIGSTVMGEILSAIGIEDTQGKILGELKEIKNHLNVIEGEIKELGQSITRLEKALAIDVQKIATMIKEAKVGAAIDSIDTHFGQTGGGLQENIPGATYINLAAILRDAAAGRQVDKNAVRTFVDNVTGTWDIPRAVVAISNGLLGEKIGTDEGLLRGWTTLLLMLLNEARPKLDRRGYHTALLNTYLTLESYYTQQVTWQLKGVVVVTNALCHTCPPDKPCAPGIGYVQSDEEFGGQLKRQVRRFLECVERIVLSQYDLDTITIVEGGYEEKDADGRSFHDVIRTIFARADLLAGSLLQGLTDEQESAAGLYGRMLCRPCDTSDGKGPTLAPAGYSAKNGVATALANLAITTDWERSTDHYPRLRDRNGTNGIMIVRYYWPWPAQPPRPGVPIDPGFQNGLSAGYRNINTLEPTDGTTPGATLVAHFVDFSRLTARPPMADSVSGNGWHISPVAELRDWTVLKRNDASTRDIALSPNFKAEGTLAITIDENEWPGRHPTIWYEMRGPLLKYTGTGTPKIRLFLLGSASAETVQAPEWPNIRDVLMGPRMQVFVVGDGREVEVLNTDKLGGGAFNLWGREAPARARVTIRATNDLQLAAGVSYDLRIVIGIPARTHWHKKKHPKKDTHSFGGIVAELVSVRLAWPTH